MPLTSYLPYLEQPTGRPDSSANPYPAAAPSDQSRKPFNIFYAAIMIGLVGYLSLNILPFSGHLNPLLDILKLYGFMFMLYAIGRWSYLTFGALLAMFMSHPTADRRKAFE